VRAQPGAAEIAGHQQVGQQDDEGDQPPRLAGG
jgi:hypothetical protein